MWMSKLKVTMALVVALGVISAGTGVVALGGRPTDSERLKKADPAPKSDEKAEPLRRQTVARLDAAKTAFDLSWTRFREGMENEQTVNLWSRRWLQAQLELSDKKADRDLAVRSHRERLQKVDEIARARLDLGGSPQPVQTVEKEQKNYETVRGHFPGALYGT